MLFSIPAFIFLMMPSIKRGEYYNLVKFYLALKAFLPTRLSLQVSNVIWQWPKSMKFLLFPINDNKPKTFMLK